MYTKVITIVLVLTGDSIIDTESDDDSDFSDNQSTPAQQSNSARTLLSDATPKIWSSTISTGAQQSGSVRSSSSGATSQQAISTGAQQSGSVRSSSSGTTSQQAKSSSAEVSLGKK